MREVRVGELLLEHPQLDRERDEPLLRAVVQVALQPPALVDARLEDAHPRGVDLRPRLGALQRQRHQLGEPRQAGLGVRPERADRRHQHEPPDPPARDDRRGDGRVEAVGAHQLRGAPAHVGVVLDPRGLAGAGDDRGQPVAVGERDRRADDEAARVVLVGPAPDRPRLPAVVADRRRRAHVAAAARPPRRRPGRRPPARARTPRASRPAAAPTAPRPAARAPRTPRRRAPSRSGRRRA